MLINTCEVAMVQKDILCKYFGFISLSPVFGETNHPGKETPAFIA